MPVNSTGLNEIFTLPELSVHSAIRPGIPASVPDFLKIMTMKAATPATTAAPSAPVGAPSADDGNPTAAAAALAAAGSEAGEDIQTTEDDADMPFDLQIPAMLTPQEKPVAAPKLPAVRFAIAEQQQDVQTPVDTGTLVASDILPAAGVLPAVSNAADEDAASDAAQGGKSGRDDDDEVPALPVIATMPAASPPPAPVAVAAAVMPAPVSPTPAPEDTALSVNADTPRRSPNLAAPAAPAVAPAPDADVAEMPDAVSTEPALPPSPAVPAGNARMKVEQPAAEQTAAEQPTPDPVAQTAEDAAPVLRALGAFDRDSDAADTSTPARETLSTASAPPAGSVLAAPQEAVRTASAAAPAPPVLDTAQLDDLLIGNAVEDQWVDRLAADVEALVSNDRREAHMVLRPRELGEMSIRLETNAGQAKVHFTVETAAAQGLITDAAPRLQAMLEDRGVRLEGASVDVGGRQDGGERGERGEPPREAPSSTKPRSAAQPEIIRQSVRQTAIERYA